MAGPTSSGGSGGAASAERRFQLLVNAVTDYAIYMLDPEGYVVNWNSGAERVKGYTADEIVGQHFSRFYTEEDQKAGMPARSLATAEQAGRFEAEGWRVRKGGSRFWANVVIDPIRDNDGTLIGFAKITRDITERKEAQEALERTQAALAQAQKMEAIGQLAGGIAHDFNNLLTIIRSSADLLRSRELSDEKRRRYVDAISDTADRAAKLTGQLLAFSRRQALKPEIFSVAERVHAVADMIRPVVGARVRLIVNDGCDPCFVEADAAQFETALVNMAVNARDAMGGEGSLTLGVQIVTEMPLVRGHKATPGEFVAVSVADTGHGIGPDKLPHIFEPFFTTKEAGKGTGLGLSQVYGFAKQSGGEVQVETEVGQGTTFTLYLPRVVRKSGKATDNVNTQTDLKARKLRVLLVEDNVNVGEFASQLLCELGHEATWASTADVALKLLAEDAKRFDLVFSDVVMPGMNGIELGRQIQQNHPHLPVVLTSGYSHVLAEEGRHDFELLRKPYSVEDLSHALRRAFKSVS